LHKCISPTFTWALIQFIPGEWNVTYTQTFVMLESAVYIEVREDNLGEYFQRNSAENRIRLELE
jgi:hypothetical protein